MAHSRNVRLVVSILKLALFLVAAGAAARFLLGTLQTRGFSPAALFGLLLLTGALALVWRAGLDLRKAIHRYRSA